MHLSTLEHQPLFPESTEATVPSLPLQHSAGAGEPSPGRKLRVVCSIFHSVGHNFVPVADQHREVQSQVGSSFTRVEEKKKKRWRRESKEGKKRGGKEEEEGKRADRKNLGQDSP